MFFHLKVVRALFVNRPVRNKTPTTTNRITNNRGQTKYNRQLLTMRAQKRTFYALTGLPLMTILKATEARSKLYTLIDEAAETHKPIMITGKRSNAVLVAEEDWNAINETLYLLSIPGMRESIREGMKEDLKKCTRKLDW